MATEAQIEARNDELRALLTAAAKRDATAQAAFAQLYSKTSSKLFGVALRIVRREDWAEEVVQECYVNIWNHAVDYNLALSAPLTWMTSIVRNRSLDWLRRPNKEDATDNDDVFNAVPSEEPGPLALLEQSKEASAIHKCMGALDEKQKKAVSLAFFEGMSHSELADALGEPLGTVKTWVRRGLLKLKDCLGTGYAFSR